MELTSLTAISPIDGRYRSKCEKLDEYFSEYAHYANSHYHNYLLFQTTSSEIYAKYIPTSQSLTQLALKRLKA